MSEEKQHNQNENPSGGWDESRIIVLLIGIALMIEGGLIYFQAGVSQAVVAGVTGVAGLTLVLFAWFVQLEDEEVLPEAEEEPVAEEEIKEIEAPAEGEEIEAAKPVEKEKIPAEEESQPEEEAKPEPIEEAAEKEEPKPEEPVAEEEEELSWVQRLSQGLNKTRTGFIGKLKRLVVGKTTIDEDLLDDLEETLFEADVGVKTTQELLDLLHKKVDEDDIKDPAQIYELLRDELKKKLTRFSSKTKFNEDGLTVFLIIGVNGVGKTTTIAKLAKRYTEQGKKVVLAAGDTFRAAAIDQISIWGERVGVDVIRGSEGGDPGALAFDAIHAAKKRGADLLIIDTAGRMHVQANLMGELKKVEKIAAKESDGGPHEILLVLDATTGQNAVQQAKLFNEALPISGLVITKLDGTAKGGVLFAVEEQIGAPVKYIGVGEKMHDLMPFDPEEFLEALFNEEDEKKKESDYKVL
jgi:fused signal recognition particle receptor